MMRQTTILSFFSGQSTSAKSIDTDITDVSIDLHSCPARKQPNSCESQACSDARAKLAPSPFCSDRVSDAVLLDDECTETIVSESLVPLDGKTRAKVRRVADSVDVGDVTTAPIGLHALPWETRHHDGAPQALYDVGGDDVDVLETQETLDAMNLDDVHLINPWQTFPLMSDLAAALSQYLLPEDVARLQQVSRAWKHAGGALAAFMHKVTANSIAHLTCLPSPLDMRQIERLDLRQWTPGLERRTREYGSAPATSTPTPTSAGKRRRDGTPTGSSSTACMNTHAAAAGGGHGGWYAPAGDRHRGTWLSRLLDQSDACAQVKSLQLSPAMKPAQVLDIVPKLHNLTALSLRGMEAISDEVLAKIALPHLRTLDACGCLKITDTGFIRLAGNCPAIERLSLQGCWRISEPVTLVLSFPKLAWLELECANNTTIASTIRPLLEASLSRLTLLKLCNICLSASAWVEFFSALCAPVDDPADDPPRLTLELHALNGFSDEVIESILQTLNMRSLRSLCQLHITGSTMTSPSHAAALMDAFRRLLTTSSDATTTTTTAI